MSRLTPELYKPEDIILNHFDDTRDMYIVAKGECLVNVLDEQNRWNYASKNLRISSYFGEISMIYGCRRTCTIVSKKYTTVARLSYPKFKEINTEFPEFQE